MTAPLDHCSKSPAAGLFGGPDACEQAKPKAVPSQTASAFAQLFAASQDPGAHEPPLDGDAGRCFA